MDILSCLLVFVLSHRQVVRFLQGLWILVSPSKIFPVVVFGQGAILVMVCVHDKLHSVDSLLAGNNKLYSCIEPELFYFDVLFFAYYFYNGVLVCSVVELPNNLLHGLEPFEICGEVHILLFQVNGVLVCLPQGFDQILAPHIVKVDVL